MPRPALLLLALLPLAGCVSVPVVDRGGYYELLHQPPPHHVLHGSPGPRWHGRIGYGHGWGPGWGWGWGTTFGLPWHHWQHWQHRQHRQHWQHWQHRGPIHTRGEIPPTGSRPPSPDPVLEARPLPKPVPRWSQPEPEARGERPSFEREPEPRFEREPAPRFEREPAPRFEREPAPRFEREPAPRFERDPEPRFERLPEPRFEPAPRIDEPQVE